MPIDFSKIKGMSDEDFAAALNSGQFADDEVQGFPGQDETPPEATPPAGDVVTDPTEPTDPTVPADENDEDENGGTVSPAGDVPPVAEPGTPTNPTDAANPAESGKAPGEAQEPGEGSGPDYESFYKEVLGKPLKVGGKEITLTSAAEVQALIQKGAHFTRNMQALAQSKKTLMMLDQAQVDDEKLALALEVLNGNPEAIKKVLKEKAIDPLDLDMNVEPAYQGGRHQVSDAQVAFQSQLEDLESTPEGTETVGVIARDWDPASKAELGKNPTVMATIHAHRTSGIYDRTVAEVERQRLLGQVPANMPFLQAYNQIGTAMAQAGAFADLAPPATQAPAAAPAAAPLARKAAVVKPAVLPNKAASAAAAPRGGNQPNKGPVSYKGLSDAQIQEMSAKLLAS